MCIKKCRDSSEIERFSSFQSQCILIGYHFEVGNFSYTQRYTQPYSIKQYKVFDIFVKYDRKQ